jgi:mRNA interferase MazF
MLERGDIWLADLNPRRGIEPGKTQPVLIVQRQALLDAGHPSTLIVPLTTNLTGDAEPLRIRVPASGRLPHSSDLPIDQLRAIDNRRLVEGPLARLPRQQMARVSAAVREVPDLVRCRSEQFNPRIGRVKCGVKPLVGGDQAATSFQRQRYIEAVIHGSAVRQCQFQRGGVCIRVIEQNRTVVEELAVADPGVRGG